MLDFFATNEIRANGWLKKALLIQAKGKNGNLDKMWPDVKDSKWIGGDKEGWERVPYWLDGFIPLAYLLNDDDMKARAKKYIDKIIENQTPTGWICPANEDDRATYDIWALFIILKALTVYADCSGDDRIEQVVYNALKNFKSNSHGSTPFNWGNARWYECVLVIAWLYAKRPEPWLVELADFLKINGLGIKDSVRLWKNPPTIWNYYSHVVNVAMSLKGDTVYKALVEPNEPITGDDARELLKVLEEYHGTATGHFTGSEILAGPSPIQGTELCGIVEAMYSYEHLLRLTGESEWGDRLEKLAFNAYPAQVTEDCWGTQYLQLVNQVGCYEIEEPAYYTTNKSESNRFGLEPNFGCCTANYGQALPKFTLSTFMKGNGEIYNTALAPATLNCDVDGNKICVEVITDYPYGDTLNYSIKSDKPFTLNIRIPAWAENFSINSEIKSAVKGWYKTTVKNGNKFTLTFKRSPKLATRNNGLFTINYGALLFALPLKHSTVTHEYMRDGVERKFPYCDYDFLPTEDWGYGFKLDEFGDTVDGKTLPLEVIFNKNYDNPFSRTNPPIKIKVPVCKINWGNKEGFKFVANDAPKSLKPTSEKLVKEFVPYGNTYLRMTELPIIK